MLFGMSEGVVCIHVVRPVKTNLSILKDRKQIGSRNLPSAAEAVPIRIRATSGVDALTRLCFVHYILLEPGHY